jgi:hypothetical protein
LRNRAVGRQYAEAGTRVPAPVAAAAAWVDLVAPRDLPRRPHALHPAPQPEGAVPAACRSECLELHFLGFQLFNCLRSSERSLLYCCYC